MRNSILAAVLLLGVTFSAKAQPTISKEEAAMQNMIVKLIVESGTGFKKIKGEEMDRKPDGAVYYKAMLSYIATGDDELGAMLTTEDNVMQVGGGTFYVATYTDDPEAPFSLRSSVEEVIKKMPYWKGDARFVFTIQPEQTQKPDELKTTVLLLNDKRVGIFNDYIKTEKSALILGMQP